MNAVGWCQALKGINLDLLCHVRGVDSQIDGRVGTIRTRNPDTLVG